MKALTRQGWFAVLKAPGGLVEDEEFGLFIEHKAKQRLKELELLFTPPFDIDKAFKLLYGLKSCGELHEKELAMIVGEFEEWRGDE